MCVAFYLIYSQICIYLIRSVNKQTIQVSDWGSSEKTLIWWWHLDDSQGGGHGNIDISALLVGGMTVRVGWKYGSSGGGNIVWQTKPKYALIVTCIMIWWWH